MIVTDRDNDFISISNRIKLYALNSIFNHYDKDGNGGIFYTVRSGDIIEVVVNDVSLCKYSIAIPGEVNGDGKISALDYVKVKNHIMNTNTITDEVYVEAADANMDDKISALDYVRIKNIIMEENK